MPINVNVPIPDTQPDVPIDPFDKVVTSDPRFTGYQLKLDLDGNIHFTRKPSYQPIYWLKGRGAYVGRSYFVMP